MLLLFFSSLIVSVLGVESLIDNFDFRPVELLLENKVHGLPENHFSRFNSQALLTLAVCLKSNVTDPPPSFDVSNIELLDESIRFENKQKLIELQACDETFSQCEPTILTSVVDQYIQKLILTKTELCAEIEASELRYLENIRLNTTVPPIVKPAGSIPPHTTSNCLENDGLLLKIELKEEKLNNSTNSKPLTPDNCEHSLICAFLFFLLSINILATSSVIYFVHQRSDCCTFNLKNASGGQTSSRIYRKTVSLDCEI